MTNDNLFLPSIPETITVHLGRPDEAAANVTVPFTEYIKNVASSEIYPTWPENAIRANIYAQISFALNRIYTEFYPSRGYDFDITNTTAFDQYFVNGREFFENISQTVDDIFDSYVVRQGSFEPLFTQYCNGTTSTCDGLSQWGTVSLANEGLTPYEILQYYYGQDINIRMDVPIDNITATFPSEPLTLGSSGDDVRFVQLRLNRISANYPAIPKINPINGIYDAETQNAVRTFQEIFNLTPDGIVGRATWYKIQLIYNGVKRLSELDSEGLAFEDVSLQFPSELSEGDRSLGVSIVQYFLAYLSLFNNEIPPVDVDGIFGPATAKAVRAFQSYYGLPVTGIVDEETYLTLFDAYRGILNIIPNSQFEGRTLPYPGYELTTGTSGEYVQALQEYLNVISDIYTQIPKLDDDGIFGPATANAVRVFQSTFGLPATGIVSLNTWLAVTSLYEDIITGSIVNPGQFPSESAFE